jgi:hypothetical protein
VSDGLHAVRQQMGKWHGHDPASSCCMVHHIRAERSLPCRCGKPTSSRCWRLVSRVEAALCSLGAGGQGLCHPSPPRTSPACAEPNQPCQDRCQPARGPGR